MSEPELTRTQKDALRICQSVIDERREKQGNIVARWVGEILNSKQERTLSAVEIEMLANHQWLAGAYYMRAECEDYIEATKAQEAKP